MATSRYPKHDELLVWARTQLGAHEEPMGSNSGPQVRWYQSATWLGGTGWPWCAAFCCRGLKIVRFTGKYWGAGAYAWYDVGAKIVGKQIPKARYKEAIAGDFVVFRIGQGHIGVLEKVVNGYVHTIDGNVSNQVAQRVRPMSEVYGFVHWAETPKVINKKVGPPKYEVVSGENGAIIYVSGLAAIKARLAQFLKRYPKGVIIKPRPKK